MEEWICNIEDIVSLEGCIDAYGPNVDVKDSDIFSVEERYKDEDVQYFTLRNLRTDKLFEADAVMLTLLDND